MQRATLPSPVHLATIDRPSVRAFVESELRYLASVNESGGNSHQALLDRQDEIEKFLGTLDDQRRDKFSELYQQEMYAAADAANQKAAEINAQTSTKLIQSAQEASNVSTWVSIVAFFVILITAIQIFRA